MVIVLSSSAVERGFEPRWGQIKECKIGTFFLVAASPLSILHI